VAGDPADVGGAPVDVGLGLQVEDVVVRRRDADEVPGGRVRDPLRLRGRTARVQEVEEVLGVHRLAGTGRRVGGLTLDEVRPRQVASLHHRDVRARALADDDIPHARARLERLVRVGLQRDLLPAPPALVLGEENLALHVVQPVGERLGREASEDHRVRGAETRAREHRDREPRPHPHVDADRSPLSDPERLQPVGGFHDLVEQLRVRDGRALTDGLPLEEVGDLVTTPGFDVAVEAVVRDVQLPAAVPLRVRGLPLEKGGERLEPRDALASLALPELLEGNVVQIRGGIRLGRELGGRRVAALLQEQRVDGAVGHRDTSRS
jgi:hypothetical protein